MNKELETKFLNQIFIPATQLVKTFALHPLAIGSSSNVLLHQFEGLILHISHFGEKNNIEISIDENLRDLANSIKHIRRFPETQVSSHFVTLYEVFNDKYRFIRNTIISEYPDKSSFDAVDKSIQALANYQNLIGLQLATLKIPESVYGFFDYAFGYNGKYDGRTKDCSFVMMKKQEDIYIKFDPAQIKYAVFNDELIGIDPTPYFPTGLL